MPTMDELLGAAGVAGADLDHLHRLVADWQLLADLSFADLLLLVPSGSERFTVAAQMRPTTGPTAYHDDLVGVTLPVAERPQLAQAWDERRIWREGDPVWSAGVPVRQEVVPVRRGDRVVALVSRDTNLAAARTPSRLEIAYLQTATDLVQMLSEGSWPPAGEGAAIDGSGPRVGDGMLRLEADGTVSFASPNALSAYRRLGHLGDLVGLRLDEVTAALAARRQQPLDEPVALVARGRSARAGEVEAQETVVQLRSLPLSPGGRHIGALVLVRDVTELRRRERQLLSKDATIREIHHRVKNNLQTVAALLRLQARRLDVPQARAALEESVRRVSSIALVHETLSAALDEAVRFDDVADQVLGLVRDMAPPGVTLRREGSFGVLPAEVATPLAMVLTELLQNAVEHGVADGGAVVVTAAVGDGQLDVAVVDDGAGLPAGFAPESSDRLGLQIVRTLVESELGGTISLQPGARGGTVARVRVRSSL